MQLQAGDGMDSTAQDADIHSIQFYFSVKSQQVVSRHFNRTETDKDPPRASKIATVVTKEETSSKGRQGKEIQADTGSSNNNNNLCNSVG